MVNHYASHANLWYIQHLLEEYDLYHYLHNSFYELLIEFRYIFFHLKTIYRQFLRYCPSIQIVCIQIHEVSLFNVFIIIFHILTICLCISTYSRYILPLIPFSVINKILISVNNSNFTSFF